MEIYIFFPAILDFFDTIKDEEEDDVRDAADILEQLPVDILTFVHKKEHVNCIIHKRR